MSHASSVRPIALRPALVCGLLALLVLVSLSFGDSGRDAQSSAETRFVERSPHGLAIVPASCASSPSYFHSALAPSGDGLGFVSSPGTSEYGAAAAGTYVCVTNPTGSTFFVPAHTIGELQTFKNAAAGLGLQAY